MQVVSFAGDLLSSAEGLLRDGLHTSEVAEGYTKAATKVCLLPFQCFPAGCSPCNAHTLETEPLILLQALEIMERLILPGSDKMDVRDPEAVAKRIKGSVCSKQYGYEDLLSPLIAKVNFFPSCHIICQEKSTCKQNCSSPYSKLSKSAQDLRIPSLWKQGAHTCFLCTWQMGYAIMCCRHA